MQQKELGKVPDQLPPFSEHLQGALQALRATIIELLAAADADPARPQDLARRFGLNKNLTWKISKVVTGTDLFAMVPHVPGSLGLETFISALEKAGVPGTLIAEARGAARDFNQVVRVHTGDRTTLDMMISGMLPAAERAERDVQSRKLAYQGNSGTWGVRVKTQLSMNILAPNVAEPDMADLVQVGGLDRFRRLRPDARWLLFRCERWSDDDPHPARDDAESLDPGFPVEEGVPFLGAFCSKPIPEVEVITAEGEDQYELPPGPVGNAAAFTAMHGQVARGVGPVHGEREGEYSEIGCNLTTPAEHLLLDLLVHREFTWAMSPQLVMYSRMDGGSMYATSRRTRNLLPVAEPVHDLGWGVAALATPLMPRYSKLVRYVFDRLRWNPDDFRVFRFTMVYPPIPTVALLRSELPVRSARDT